MPPNKFKFLDDIRSRRRNVRAIELRKLMSLFDFTFRNTKHGLLYKHNRHQFLSVLVAEHREKGQEKKVFKPYIDKCIGIIEELLLME